VRSQRSVGSSRFLNLFLTLSCRVAQCLSAYFFRSLSFGITFEADNDPTAHAEILAIRAAADMLDAPRLPDCDLYVTLEPCAMCSAAISFARIRRLYFGAYDVKGGSVEHGARFFGQTTCHHAPDVYGGIAESDCAGLLKEFFRNLRD